MQLSRFTNLLLIVFFIAIASCKGSKTVGKDKIEEDLRVITNATKMKNHFNGKVCEPESPLLKFLKYETSGQSCEGATCIVKAEVSVVITEAMKIEIKNGMARGCLGGSEHGFSSWMGLKYDEGYMGYRDHTRIMNGTMRKFAVTMHYRKYDTGWKLESYE